MADGSERRPGAGPTAANGDADGSAYRFGDAVIAVEVGDPDGARWLCELLTPWFALVASVAGGPRVRVTPSAGRFAELAATQLQAATRPLPTLTTAPWSRPDAEMAGVSFENCHATCGRRSWTLCPSVMSGAPDPSSRNP